MIHARSYLGRALVLSLILHAAVVGVFSQFTIPLPSFARPAEPDIKVTLRMEAPVAEAPALMLPEPQPPQPSQAPRKSSPAASVATAAVPVPATAPYLSGEAARSAAEQMQRELLYPREAIERGLQGEALVLLFLDASGNALAARIESSSGHALLDDAAVRAARTLRALPDSAPRDVILQVRFRLR